MPNLGLHGINGRILGVNRVNTVAAQVSIGGAVMLGMDDPEFTRTAHANGILSIYRQSGDAPENDPLRFTATDFMRERLKNAAGSDYVHSYNEIDPQLLLHTRTLEGMKLAEAAGQKAIIYNLGTNKSRAQWESCLENLRYAAAHGHGIGVHFYPDGKHDDGGLQWREIKHAVGGFWCFTEFGYLRDIADATRGWRGTSLDKAAFIRQWTPLLEAENMPACWFCYDFWDQPTVEIAKAEGLGYNDLPDVLNTFAAENRLHTWSGIPVTQPTTIPVNAGVGVPSTVVAVGVRFRAAPDLNAAEIRKLTAGEHITVFPGGATVVDGFPFRFARDAKGNAGWSSVADKTGAVWIQADATPEVWTVKLDVPFVPQQGTTANAKLEDCGAACAVSVARYAYTFGGYLDPVNFTVDDFAAKTALAHADTGLTSDQVAKLLMGYGLQAKKATQLTLADLKQRIKDENPPIVLVNYKHINPAHPATLGHFITLIGYNDGAFLAHDAYLLGASITVSNAALTVAMNDVSSFTSTPNQGVILT